MPVLQAYTPIWCVCTCVREHHGAHGKVTGQFPGVTYSLFTPRIPGMKLRSPDLHGKHFTSSAQPSPHFFLKEKTTFLFHSDP